MATRSKQVFVTLDEFIDWLRDLTSGLSLTALLYRGPAEPMKIWSGDENELVACDQVFLSTDVPDLETIQTSKLRPGEHGWVELDVPRTEGNALLLCQIAAKSDWFDAERSEIFEDPRALRLYDKVWRRLKKRVHFPVWAYNKVTGSDAIPYRSVGYSKGAKQWSRSGGALAQEGVANVRFEIRDL